MDSKKVAALRKRLGVRPREAKFLQARKISLILRHVGENIERARESLASGEESFQHVDNAWAVLESLHGNMKDGVVPDPYKKPLNPKRPFVIRDTMGML